MKRDTSFIGPGGTIVVKAGDTISKYCSLIYGISPASTRPYWDEFCRVVDDVIIAIQAPYLIRVGETIVHLPHYNTINLPPVTITAKWSIAARFHLRGSFQQVTTGLSIFEAGGMRFNGQLFVEFTHKKSIYAWDPFTAWLAIAGVGTPTKSPNPLKKTIPLPQSGLLISEPSEWIEFHYNEFDPIEFWKIVCPNVELAFAQGNLGQWNLGPGISRTYVKIFLRTALAGGGKRIARRKETRQPIDGKNLLLKPIRLRSESDFPGLPSLTVAVGSAPHLQNFHST